MALSEYRLFNKDGELIVIGDDLELSILESLAPSEKSFSQLLIELKVPKSTLSTKIDLLKEQKIIAEISVPEDKRKRVYRLNGHLVSKRADGQSVHGKKDSVGKQERSHDPQTIIRSMRCMLCESGVADQTMLSKMGNKIGQDIAGKISGKGVDAITKGLDIFLRENHLGQIQIIKKDPLVVDVEEFEICRDIEGSGRSFCAFDEGILQSVFSAKLGKKVLVKEMADVENEARHTKYVVLFE